VRYPGDRATRGDGDDARNLEAITVRCPCCGGGHRIVQHLLLEGGDAQTAGGQGNKTAWDSYKNRSSRPSADQHLTDPVLVGAIDLHAHSDPDSYPRQWDGFDVAKLAKDRGMRAVLLKNHWTETAGLAYLVRKYGAQGIEVFGGLSLDTPVGGINPQAVRYMVDVVGHYGRIVWMPTHDSEHEVKYLNENREFVSVSRDGKLLPEVLARISHANRRIGAANQRRLLCRNDLTRI
jgi:hypothetical protein